jgi:hypothetical protein
MRTIILAVVLLVLLQGCAIVNPYPAEWPALQRENLIHAPPPDGPKMATACPLVVGIYANEGERLPADAPPLHLTDFFPRQVGDASQVAAVRIDQTEATLGITFISKDGASTTESFKRGNVRMPLAPLLVNEFSCIYDIGLKDHGFRFSGLGPESSAGGVPGLLLMEGRETLMRTAVDRSLVVTVAEGRAALVVFVPVGRMKFTHYRFPALDAAR